MKSRGNPALIFVSIGSASGAVHLILSLTSTGAGTKERGLTLSPRRLLPWWGGHGDVRKGTAVNGVQGRADCPS